MSLVQLQDSLGDFANDIKINLSNVFKEENGMTRVQIAGIALSSAYTTRNKELMEAIEAVFSAELTDAIKTAAKAACTLMAMNNVYYRAVHLMSDQEYLKMPAQLRMNFMTNPGVEKLDFEMYSLAVSAINGCGMCIDSHANKLSKDGVSKPMIQHVLRIAGVVNATAQAIYLS